MSTTTMETVERLTMVTWEDAVGNERVDDTARGGSRQQQLQVRGMAEAEGEETTRQRTMMMMAMMMITTMTMMATAAAMTTTTTKQSNSVRE
jgi:hypothetical protein